MTTITLDSSCTVTGATPAEVMQIKDALTLKNPAYTEAVKRGRYTGNLDRYLKYYSETEGGLIIPRGFTGGIIDICGPVHLVDQRRALKPINFTFTGTLRYYQVEAIEDAARFDFGVMEAATGSGKTTMALALIEARQQPTLILVHNKELLYQWQSRIKQFLFFEAGLIGDGKLDIQPVTVGIINSVKNHLDEIIGRFGHMVCDECHRCPAKMFTDVVAAFDCKYMLGLSATTYRRDGLDKVINIYLGRTVHRVSKRHLNESGAVLRPEIMQIETSFSYDYQDDYSKMISNLVEDEPRNRLIVNEAVKAANRGVVLVVSDRVSHCARLAALLSARRQKATALTGQTPKKKRAEIVNAVQEGKIDFLVSTLSLISEGFDCSGLTVLVLATPVSFRGRLTQVAGRILRPGPDKMPMVVDFLDSLVGVLAAGAVKRLKILNGL